MQHFYIRKAGILLAKTAFLAFGLGSIWMMLSLVEPDGYPWWLVTLASVGSMCLGCTFLCLGCTFLIGAMVAEDELNEDIARTQQVPVRKIERRSSRRHSA